MALVRVAMAVCLLAGCGGDDGAGRSDASSPTDATPDSSPDLDAGAGTVTITMYSYDHQHQPLQDVIVLFTGPDGGLVARVTTDSDGKASAEVLPGSSLTTIRIEGDFAHLSTFHDIKPGDEIETGLPVQTFTSQTMDVTFDDSVGTDFLVCESCGCAMGAGSPITTHLFPECVRATEDFLLVLRSDGKPTSFEKLDDVPFVEGGSVDASSLSWAAMGSFSAMFTGIPADITNIGADYGVRSDDGTAFDSAGSVVPDESIEGISVPYPVGFGIRSALTLSVQSSTGLGEQWRISTKASVPASAGLDLGASLIPWLQDLPSFTPETRSVSFTTTGSGSWKVGRCLVGYANNDWALFAPPGAETIALPDLPDDLAALGPQPSDTVNVECELFDSDTAGVDDMRVHAENITTYLDSLPPPQVWRRSGYTFF